MCSSTAAKAANRLAASTVGKRGRGTEVGSWLPGPTGCVGGTNCLEKRQNRLFQGRPRFNNHNPPVLPPLYIYLECVL